MDFSNEQKNVINAKRENILVSAAAGSGKTTVLVHRITSKIISGEMGIDEVLVVTFTKEAANNMRMKMEAEINKMISTSSPKEKELLKAELDKLPGSYIQTMHSFCNRALSESSYLLGEDAVEPGSMIIDENTKKLLWNSSASKAINNTYILIAQGLISEEDTNDFKNLVFSMGGGKKDDALAGAMCDIYDTLRSLPNYLDVLDSNIKEREEADQNGILIGSDYYINANRNLLNSVVESCNKIIDLPCADSKYVALGQNVKTALKSFTELDFDNLSTQEKLEAIKKAYSDFASKLSGSKFPAVPKDDPLVSLNMGPITALVYSFKKELGISRAPAGYKEMSAPYFLPSEFSVIESKTYDELLELQKRRTSCARAVNKLIKSMDEEYARLKKNIGGLDYSDLEHMCLKSFENEEICSIYKNKFKEIYIDEYQDNTTLQDAIVSYISNDNVFSVGDVKQSIYKFRHANPKMFTLKADSYRDKNGGVLYELTQNYRSTPEILSFVNEVFGQLMSKDASEIGYIEDNHQMKPNKDTLHGPIPEVILIDTKQTYVDKDENTYKESDLLSRQTYLKVVELSKKYDYKQMYVLTRTKNSSSDIAEYLKSMGIPARSIVEQSVFADNEIIGLCNLIFVLANENRDECMAGVMLAPYRFSNFTPDELATICVLDSSLRNMNLIVKVKEYAQRGDDEDLKNRCIRFVDALDSLRSESVILNISDLMELIFMETGIKATARLEGSSELTKIKVFKNWICDNFLARRCDISDVAFAIEEIKGKIGDDATVEVEDFGENFVRCMNYHKSKGLEKECVIIADTDGVGGDKSSSFLKFREDKLVFSDYDDEKSTLYGSLEWLSDNREDILSENAETIRLLYVAYTRAKENLTIIRCKNISDDNDKKVQSMCNLLVSESQTISADFYEKYGSSGNLIISSIVRLKTSEDSSDLADCIGVNGYSWKSDFDGVTVRVTNGANIVSSIKSISDSLECSHTKSSSQDDDKMNVYGLIEYDDRGVPSFEPYRFADSVNTAAKTSVSALKKQAESIYSKDDEVVLSETDKMRNAINLQLLDFEDYISSESKLSSSEFGSAIHKTLHFIDLDKISKDMSCVDSEIEALYTDGILSEVQKNEVLKFASHIVSFALSNLGLRLIDAQKKNNAKLELPVLCAIRINPDRSDYQLVQGVIDALIIEADGAVIIDYKTDSIKSDDKNEIIEIVKKRHKEQLDLYAATIEKSGIHVKEKYVRLLRKNMDILI